MKKLAILLSILLCSILIVTGCGKKTKEKVDYEPVVKENKNEGVIREQTVDGIEFTNTSLKTVDGMSTIVTEITNNTDTDYDKEKFIIIIKDKDGKVMQELDGYINSVIPPGGSLTITSGVDIDLSEAYSVDYKAIE